MDWNENLIAFLATLSGWERKFAISCADNKPDEAFWYVPSERRTELFDLVIAHKYSYTTADEHRADIENVKRGGHI